MDWFLYDNGLRHEKVKQIICEELNRFIEISRLPRPIKAANITPVFKKTVKRIRHIIGQLIYYQTC